MANNAIDQLAVVDDDAADTSETYCSFSSATPALAMRITIPRLLLFLHSGMRINQHRPRKTKPGPNRIATRSNCMTAIQRQMWQTRDTRSNGWISTSRVLFPHKQSPHLTGASDDDAAENISNTLVLHDRKADRSRWYIPSLTD